MKALEINSRAEFEQVLAGDKPVLVDFWASWCGPCKMVAPEVEALAESYEGKAMICKIDVDAQRDIASQFQVMSIPTLVFLKNGEEANRIVGYKPRTEIAKLLDTIL